MDWIHKINPHPGLYRILVFRLQNISHFLEQYCNPGIYNITRIIDLGAPIEKYPSKTFTLLGKIKNK